MNLKHSVGRWTISVGLFGLAACAQAGGIAPKACSLPPQLTDEIQKALPDFKVIETSLLRAKDRALFEREHPKACPGAAKVDFFGTGRPTYALSVARKAGDKLDVRLVVATTAGDEWRITALDDANQIAAPVIWAEPAGKYIDTDTDKTVEARNPVVVFATYESWAIVYSWNGKAVDRAWVSD